MTSDQRESRGAGVVPFRPRSTSGPDGSRAERPEHQPVDGIERYASRGDDDDYRHRMLTNAAGLAIAVLLVLAGMWLAIRIADMQKDQDCVLAGRRGCTPVEVPARDRW